MAKPQRRYDKGFDLGKALRIRQENALKGIDTAAREAAIVAAVLAQLESHRDNPTPFLIAQGGFSKMIAREIGPEPDPCLDSFGPTNPDFHLWAYLTARTPDMRFTVQMASARPIQTPAIEPEPDHSFSTDVEFRDVVDPREEEAAEEERASQRYCPAYQDGDEIEAARLEAEAEAEAQAFQDAGEAAAHMHGAWG